ncbi:MAG: acetylornithine aminotransferase [Saprospiraceae bacterium]|nr:MAG: acetylornithine aminotransferase [Saprospiraceae bacterium]
MNLFPVYPLFDIEPVRGQGCYVYDKLGHAYLDFYGGHAVISIGHSHPHFVKRLQAQLQALAFYSNSVQNPLQEQLAKKLGQLSGLEDYQLFLCNSGAEANENALKLASFHNGRQKVISFKNSFHGRTSAAVNITDKESIKAPINKTFPVEFHAWNDLDSVAKSLKKGDVCAVIIEGIQGIGGIHIPDAAFLESLAQLCKQQDTLLILDEIQSGYGRSGRFFAFQNAKIQPDLVTTAKGMGNGFPIGGVLIHPRFQGSHGLLGTTFGGSHLACAAGLAVLEVLEAEKLIENARKWGAILLDELRHLRGLTAIRGQGLMIGLEFEFPVGDMRKQLLFEHQIFTGSASDANVMRLLPPLCVGEKEVDLLIGGLTRETIQKVQNSKA